MFIICILLIIIVLLVLHHYIKHRNDNHLTIYEKFFQISDVNNHETFVLLFFGMMLGIILARLCYK